MLKTILLCYILFIPVTNSADIEVTLLGTGDPTPRIDRFGPATLVKTKDSLMLFDVGRGAMQRLYQINTSTAQIDAIFLTHLHSDHLVGFVYLWLTGWVVNRREKPLKVYGPGGTKAFVKNLVDAFEFDINIRVNEARRSRRGVAIEVTEIDKEFVWHNKSTAVKAFLVDHSPVEPAFGYRVDANSRSVVLSGDTKYSENLILNSKGTDVLIHEVAEATAEFKKRRPNLPRLAHHTQAVDAGIIFAKVKPKLAVYSHLVLVNGFAETELIPLTRQSYEGPLVVGEDLMTIHIGETVTYTRFDSH